MILFGKNEYSYDCCGGLGTSPNCPNCGKPGRLIEENIDGGGICKAKKIKINRSRGTQTKTKEVERGA